jgi:hypothetical protein
MTAHTSYTRHTGATPLPVPLGEFRCASCGYGIVARGLLPDCPAPIGSRHSRPVNEDVERAKRAAVNQSHVAE